MASQNNHQNVSEHTNEGVMSRHREWLVRLVSSRTQSQAMVEDVMQEIGLAIAHSKHPPKHDEDLRPWLCTIAIRQCALALRKATRQRRLETVVAENADDSGSKLEDPIFWLLNRERSKLLRDALKELDEDFRALLVWKYVEGKTYPELANQLNTPTHVLEYRVTKAKSLLRQLLIARGVEKEDLL